MRCRKLCGAQLRATGQNRHGHLDSQEERKKRFGMIDKKDEKKEDEEKKSA